MSSSTRPGTAAGRLATGRDWLTAWLARPLTSLHLVLGVFGLLTLFGLVMVLSASNVESYTKAGSSYAVFVQQLAYCGLGLVLFSLGLRMPVRMLRGTSGLFLLVCVLLLIMVLSPLGAEINGAQKWLRFGPFPCNPPSPRNSRWRCGGRMC